jgi:hypothetical protein
MLYPKDHDEKIFIEKLEAAFVPYGSVDWWVHRDSIAKAQQALRRPLGSYGVMVRQHFWER